MTTITHRSRPTSGILGKPERLLRTVLSANAVTSLAAGIVAAVAAPWVSDTFGTGSVAWTRIIGVALIVFAVDVAFVARRAGSWILPATAAISAVDFAWVVGTAVVLATVSLTTAGWIVAVVMAVGVADFAVAQMWLRQRLTV